MKGCTWLVQYQSATGIVTGQKLKNRIWKKYETNNNMQKTMKHSDYKKILQQRARDSPLSGPIIHEHTLLFWNNFQEGDANFNSSIGWLSH